MENASKALIIAGAILISILLISVGIIVMNSINKPIDQATAEADSQAIEMFNSKFTGYLGKNQSAQAMKALITSAKSITDRAITIEGTYNTTSKLVTNKKYTAEAEYDSNGYINKITIEETTT